MKTAAFTTTQNLCPIRVDADDGVVNLQLGCPSDSMPGPSISCIRLDDNAGWSIMITHAAGHPSWAFEVNDPTDTEEAEIKSLP